jgi:hypothetical protein
MHALASRPPLCILAAFTAACSGYGAQEPQRPILDPSLIPPAPAAPPATASAAPELLAPRPGTERRAYTLFWVGDSARENGVPIAIDVPAVWGVDVDTNGDPEFLPCRADPLFGRLSLVAHRCPKGDAQACLDSQISSRFSGDHLAAAKREDKGPLRRWMSVDQVEGGSRRIRSSLITIDPPSGLAIECLVMGLFGKDIALAADYKQACESLLLRPAGIEASTPTPIAARPDPGATEAAEASPTAKATAALAAAFFDAMLKQDVKAASHYLPTEADCAKGPPEGRKNCVKYVTAVQKGLPGMFAAPPRGFEAGVGAIEQQPDSPGPGITSVEIHSKADPCGPGQPLLISEMGGRLVITPAVKADDKRPSPKKK